MRRGIGEGLFIFSPLYIYFGESIPLIQHFYISHLFTMVYADLKNSSLLPRFLPTHHIFSPNVARID